MKNPKNHFLASVIIPTYNRKDLLDHTLLSLTRQTIAPRNFETIIVDDGSTDNTLEVVEKYKDILDIQYFYQEDLGYRLSTARNLGLRSASSQLCVLIDAGIVLPTWGLEEHLNTHAQYTQPIAVIGYLYGLVNADRSGRELSKLIDLEDIDQSLERIKQIPAHADMREKVLKSYNYSLRNLPAPWIFFWGGNVSFDRSAFEKDEFYFNEIFDLNWGCEDVEFGYRLFKKGVEIVLSPKAEAIHYPHPKYKGFEAARLTNIAKFHSLYQSHETQLLYDISKKDIDNIYLNDYLNAPVPKASL